MAKIFTIAEGLENMGALRTGGQGSVYKGKRVGEIITAIKLLPTPIHAEDSNDKNYRSFTSEVEKLKKVNEIPNPNVVKILSYGITDSGSLPYIEMEFIEGPDLEELLKAPHDPVFTIREVLKVADHLSNALAHCHRVGVKHGDIKSNNVKFNKCTGNYVLLDFGLAVMSDEQRRTSMRHAGAIEFMAPEQNQGEMHFQTDIYSFGIVLYELMAGRVPFPLTDQGETSRNHVMISHMEVPVPDLLEKRKEYLPEAWPEEMKNREMLVPEWLVDVIRKCLEKDPQNRFKDGMELHDAIAQNSSLPENSKADIGAVALLKADNERLRSELEDHQRRMLTINQATKEGNGNAAKKSILQKIKPIALVGICLFLGFFMSSFLRFRSSAGAENALRADTAILNAENRRLIDSLELLRAKHIADSVEAVRKLAEARNELKLAEARYSEAKNNSGKGKKKHKFLGIRF